MTDAERIEWLEAKVRSLSGWLVFALVALAAVAVSHGLAIGKLAELVKALEGTP